MSPGLPPARPLQPTRAPAPRRRAVLAWALAALSLAALVLPGCGGAPAPAPAEPASEAALADPGADRLQVVTVQLAQGAQPPAVVGDHICQPDRAPDPRTLRLRCAGPGGPGLLRALRAQPGVLSATLDPTP